MKKENKKNLETEIISFNVKYVIFINCAVILFGLFFIFYLYPNQTNSKIEEPYKLLEEKTGCNNIYLGFCFDTLSEFYKKDLIKEECNEENFEIVSTIKFMEENNIKMYVSSTCPVCKQQLQQFGDYQFALATKELVIFCDKVKDIGCSDVIYVPSWKQDNKIIKVGVIKLFGNK